MGGSSPFLSPSTKANCEMLKPNFHTLAGSGDADAVLNLTATTSKKRSAVPRRANVSGFQVFASLNPRLESNKEEGKAALKVSITCQHLSSKLNEGR